MAGAGKDAVEEPRRGDERARAIACGGGVGDGEEVEDVGGEDAEELDDGDAAGEDGEDAEGPREGAAWEGDAEPDGDDGGLVGAGPVVDDGHHEAEGEEGESEEEAGDEQQEAGEADEEQVVGGAVLVEALFELPRVLVEEDHVDEEGEAQLAAEEKGRDQAPQLEAFERVGEVERQVPGVDQPKVARQG